MAPESDPSTTTQNAPETQAAGIIQVPAAAAGASVAVDSTPGAEYKFGFDPGAATMSRDGANLVFQVDGGGTVTINNFFVLGDDKQYPTFVMADGAEVPSLPLLENSGLDVTPAAGPAANATPPGGGTNYDDNGGSLIDGINRLGSLGTDYWGRGSEVPENQIGLERAGGSFGIDTSTGGAGDAFFVAGLYEDARPYQNESAADAGRNLLHAGELHFNFTPTGTTTVTGIHLSGFDAGTKIYSGDPANGGALLYEVTGTGQVLNFTQGQFNASGQSGNPGIFVVPPGNSDHDMNIHAVVDMRTNGGNTGTLENNFTIIVDAVADLPVEFGADAHVDATQAGAEHALGANVSGEAAKVSIDVNATFTDVRDGSESHYFEVKGVPSDWLLTKLPAGWNLVDAAGNHMTIAQWNAAGHDANTILRIDVSQVAVNALVPGGDDMASVSGNIEFNPQDWTSSGTGLNAGGAADVGRHNDGSLNTSGPADIQVRAVAEDHEQDRSLSTGNNRAETDWTHTSIDLKEDTPDLFLETNLQLDEAAGTQTSIGEVPLASLTQNIQDAVGGAVSGYAPLGNALGTVSQTGIMFNLHSDGYGDTGKATVDANGNHIAASSQIALAWDMSALPTDLSAKLPEDTQYYDVQFRQSGPDADGQYTLVGYYTVGGVEHVALVGVLTPDFASGGGNVTFVQYAAFEHADGNDRNDLSTGFGIKLTDDDGDVTKATVSLTIQDDVPTALGDMGILGNEASAIRGSVFTGADPESSYHTVNGNVIHQEWDPSVSGHSMNADDYGSDGRAAVDGLVWKDSGATFKVVLDGGTEVTLTHNVDHTLTGSDGKSYGTLSLNPDGTFEYTKPVGAVFKGDIQVDYTITDADKDSANATLVLKVTDSGITIPDGPGPDGDPSTPEDNIISGTVNIQVNEAGLHRGTDQDNTALTDKTGTFTIEAKDGLATLFIGGQQILFSENPVTHEVTFLGVQGSADGSLSSAKYGDMVITNITGNPTTGYTVSYHYTLDDRAQHGDNVDPHNTNLADANKNEAFAITMTDKDGDSFNGNVAVTIVDDAPIAKDDAATFDEKIDTPIGGNVLLNDMSGADGWQNGGWSDGKPGTSDAGEGGNGVVGYTLNLPAGYSVVGNPGTLTLGTEYTIQYKSTLPAPSDGFVEQGTFKMNADGTWTFSSTGSQDVTKDFNFTAHYTIKDADGDTDSANLNVTVKAAPILAGLSGSAEVFESTHTTPGASSTDDAAGKGHYDVQLYNYDGAKAEGTALYEDVTVTIKVTFGTAGMADFDATAIQGLPNYTAIPGGFTFTQTVSAGDADGKVSFELPLNDDSRGGFGTTSDGPVETYKVDITGVQGPTLNDPHYLQPGDTHYTDPAMTGVHTDQNTNIIDDGTTFNTVTNQYEYMDNRLDGATPYSHAKDAHPLDGPMLGLNDPAASIKEGDTASIRLVDTNPNTGAAYTAGSTAVEPIELTMKFDLTNGATTADVTVKYASVAGATYQYSTDGTNWIAIPATGIPAAGLSSGSVFVKVTLSTGFDLSGLKNVGLNVTAVNDNLSEAGKHEGFSVAITSVHGNESTYYGAAHGTEINDVYTNTLAISGTPEVWESGTLAYTLTLHTDAAITAGTDTVKAVLDFSGSADFGKDYTLADIQAANSGLTFTDLGNGKVEVSIPAGQWSNQAGAGDHTITLKVPTVHDNQIGEHDEHVIIKIDSATGAEIASTSGTGDGIIKDNAAISLTATNFTQTTPNIYEDQAMATSKGAETIAHYQVNFKHDTGFGSDHLDNNYSDGDLDKLVYTGAGDKAATAFTFNVSLKDGSAGFDANMLNNTTDANTKDYGWALPTGIIQYGDLTMTADFNTVTGAALTNPAQDFLIKSINDYLTANGFDGIKVIDVSNGGRTLTFAVSEGADLSKPLPIHVGAIDDRITENSENFSVILSNIKADADTHIKVDTDNKVGTTILDDNAVDSRDGFLVGVDNSVGQESDKFIKLPIVLFERGADGNPVDANQGNPPSQAITVTLTAGATGDTAGMNQDYYTDGGSTITRTINGGTANWEYVPGNGTPGTAGYIPSHWVAKNVSIPLNDDRLTEGDEKFTVKLTGVSGHESSLLPDNAVNGIDGKAELTIKDDTLAAHNLEGPALLSFGPMADVIEPVRTNLSGADGNGDPINQLEGAKTVNYQVTLSQAVAQPTIVFIKIDDTSWDDFQPKFGNGTGGTLGVLGDGTNGTWTVAQLLAAYPDMAKYGFEDGKGLDANGGGYFLIIPTGSATGTFGVQILHDHDTANDGKGIDSGVDRIDMTITNIQGSETTFDKNNIGTQPVHTNEAIQDDMRGPIVHLDLAASAVSGEPFTLTAEMANTATEDVVVRVMITDADGNESFVDVTIKAGQLLGSAQATVSSDYIYTQIVGSTGGETQHNPDLQFMDLTGGTGGTNPRIVLEFESASNITEEDETTVGYTIDGHIPTGHINEDLSFTLKVVNNSTENGDFKDSGPGHDVKVTIPKDLLDDLTNAGKSDFKVVINPDGTAILTDADGNKIGDLNVQGDLAQAFDDKLIEGDEHFSTIITKITGNGTVGDANGDSTVKAIADSTIEDNDVPQVHVVFCDAAGNILPVDGSGNPIQHGQEGHGDVFVKVVLTVPGGDPLNPDDRLDLGNGGVTFNLTPGGTATNGADFSVTRDSVTVPNGSSESAPVRVILPDDFKSENPETLTISATPDTDPATITNYPNGFIPGSTGNQTLTIDDFINGPQITFTADKTTVAENGSVNYWVTLDKALEEDDTLTFKVDLAQGDSKDGFTLGEIKSIVVDGKTYTYDSVDGRFEDAGGNDGSAKVAVDISGNLIINMTMDNGFSKEGFTINLANDYITESTETLKVTLVDTQGGELGYGGTNADGSNKEVGPGNQPSASTSVTDVLDGPTVGLVKVDAAGIEGETVRVDISLSKATVSATTIVLKLGADVADDVLDSTRPITVTGLYSNNAPYSTTGTLNANGTVTVTLPADVKGPLHVDFPLQDNAVSGGTNHGFSVSLDASGVIGGESSLAGGQSYTSTFVSETTTSLSFTLTGTGVPNADATCTISLPGAGIDNTDIASVTFTVGGHAYTVPGSALSVVNGALTYTVPDKVGVSLAGVPVTVNFATAGMTPAEIAAAKLNTSVTGTLSGMSLNLPVNDDLATHPDGPVFSVTADHASVVEGAAVTFTVHPEPKADFATTEQNITLKFTLGNVQAGDTVNVAGLPAGATYTGPAAGGVYTVTYLANTGLASNNGDFTVTVTPAADSTLGTDKSISLTLTSVNGGEASLSNTTSVTVGVTEGSAADLVVSSSSLEVIEGGSLSFNLHLQNAVGGAAMSAAAAVTLTFAVAAADITMFLDTATAAQVQGGTDATVGNLTWHYDNMAGAYHVSGNAVFGANGDASLNIPTINNTDGMVGGDLAPHLQLVDVDAHGPAVNFTATDYTATVHDVDTAHAVSLTGQSAAALNGMEVVDLSAQTTGGAHDFSASTHGVVFAGGSGDDTITGSAHSDIIIGGLGGHDHITGGLGNDTITGGSAGYNTLLGGEGDDVLFGGAGGYDTIHGGMGNDVMHSGTGGHNIFAWSGAEGDYHTGDVDKVLDFKVGSDSLKFDDLISGQPGESLSATLGADNSLNITVTHGGAQQQVNVCFDSNTAIETTNHGTFNTAQALADHCSTLDQGQQQALMQDLLTKITTS